LGLASQSSKGAGVQDPVAVALEARPKFVGLLLSRTIPSPVTPGGATGEQGVNLLFTLS
jgi:hypothetical protein